MNTVQMPLRLGRVGDMLASCEIVTTASGRRTTPFPKVDLTSNRKATNTLKRVEQWLHDNAFAEAAARGDWFNMVQFGSENPKCMPPATKDAVEEYLFGNQPAVVHKSTISALNKVQTKT